MIPGRRWLAVPWLTRGGLAAWLRSLAAVGPALQRPRSGRSWGVVVTRRHKDGRLITCTEERPDLTQETTEQIRIPGKAA